MKMIRRAVFTAALVGLQVYAQQAAVPSNAFVPSDELNSQLPRWVRFSGEYRGRLEGFTGGGFKADNDDLYFLNRFRINLKLQPTSWLKFQFQGQDARVWGKNQNPAAPPFQDTMDLRMAFAELGDNEKGNFGIRVGRQELAFGEQRLIGHVSWLNTARTFDAVRGTVRYKGYRLDAFASTVVNAKEGEFNEHTDGNNLHGLYGGIEKLVPNAVIEPYVFWRLSQRLTTEAGARGNLDFKAPGFRFSGKLPANFDYSVEMVKEMGGLGADDISAWAGSWRLGYTMTKLRFKPRLVAEYNYASGDRNPRDGKRGTFDPLYPTPHDKYGLADQVGWKNIHDLRLGTELKPHAKWLVSSFFHDWWLASKTDALYAAGGVAVARVAAGTAGRHVGEEIDVQATYTVNKQLQVAGGFAHIFPGQFLKTATPGKSYNFPYLMLGYSF
jgi:hypothetical protein